MSELAPRPDVPGTGLPPAPDAAEQLVAERAARARAELAADRLTRLQAVTSALATALTVDDVVDVVIALAVQAAGADAGAVALREGDEPVASLRRTIGYDLEVVERYQSFPLTADLPLARAVRTGRPVLHRDVLGAEVPAQVTEIAAATRCCAVATLPLLVGGRTTGAVALWFTEPQPFDDDQVAFLVAVATQSAAALERTHLWRSAQLAADRLAFLADVTAAVSSTLDRIEILRRVTQLSVPRLADWAVGHLLDGDRLRRVALAHADREHGDEVAAATEGADPHVDDEVHPAAVALRRRAPLVLSASDPQVVDRFPERSRRLLELSGVRSAVSVPVISRDEPLGVLTFALADPARHHGADDVAVASELAARVAVALENAGRYEREHRIAEMLQRAVLPERLPEVDGVDLAARYLPASADLEVGGDWYDAVALPGGRVGLAVGDVVGHGLRAAAVMGQARNALRALALDRVGPATVLDGLDQLLRGPDGGHVTATYAVLDPARGELRWASAGHPPPVVVGGDGAVTVVEDGRGPVLGAVPGRYREARLALEPGAAVVLYTDGLVERRGEVIDEGIGRLVGALAALGPAAATASCDAVVEALLGRRSRRDDVCLLVARRS